MRGASQLFLATDCTEWRIERDSLAFCHVHTWGGVQRLYERKKL